MLKKSKLLYLLVVGVLFTSSISYADGNNYQNINCNSIYNIANSKGNKLNYNYGNFNSSQGKLWDLIISKYNNSAKPGFIITTPSKPSTPSVPEDTTEPSVPEDTTKPSVPEDTTKPSVPEDTTKPSVPEDTTTGMSAEEIEVVRLVNIERQKAGLSAFKSSSELSKVARIKSQDMATNNYFSHTSPTYGSPFDMMKTFGIKYTTAGENIAKGYLSAQSVVDGWMNSPGHRANILNSRFNTIGVGAYKVGNTIYWTQMFTN